MGTISLTSNNALTMSGSGETTWGIALSDISSKIKSDNTNNAKIKKITLKFSGTSYNNAAYSCQSEYYACGLVNSDSDVATSNSGGTGGTNLFKYGKYSIGSKSTVTLPSQSIDITTYFGSTSPHSVQNTDYSRLGVAFTSQALAKKTYTFSLSIEVEYHPNCTVTFKNWDGTVLKTETVIYEGSATAPSNPSRSYDSTYHYTFKSWDKSYSSITSDITVTATYNSVAHSYTTETARTPSTCVTKGSVTKKCSCGATQTTELALDPNNHTGGTELKNVASATCTVTGYTGDTHCKSCGVKLSSGSTISALGHSYSSVATQPTENSKGYTTNTCSRCGHSYVDKHTCLVTLKVNNSSYGTVAGGKICNQGETVTITATPNADCMFISWNDGVTIALRSITATDSITYTAYFGLNAVYVDTSQSVIIYTDLKEAEKVYADETIVYG